MFAFSEGWSLPKSKISEAQKLLKEHLLNFYRLQNWFHVKYEWQIKCEIPTLWLRFALLKGYFILFQFLRENKVNSVLTWFHVEIHHTPFFKSVKMSRSTFTRKCCQNTIWQKKFLFSSEDWITQQTHKHRSARSCYSQLTEKSKKAPNLQAPICEREGHMRSAECL